jgi:hypothetical protein
MPQCTHLPHPVLATLTSTTAHSDITTLKAPKPCHPQLHILASRPSWRQCQQRSRPAGCPQHSQNMTRLGKRPRLYERTLGRAFRKFAFLQYMTMRTPAHHMTMRPPPNQARALWQCAGQIAGSGEAWGQSLQASAFAPGFEPLPLGCG